MLKTNHRHILVVDDHHINCQLLLAWLQEFADIGIAHCGEDALALVKLSMDSQGLIDTILLDINLPDISGVEVCRQIRALEQKLELTPLNIIAVSAQSDCALKIACLDAGFDDFFTKPLDRKVLLARLAISD